MDNVIKIKFEALEIAKKISEENQTGLTGAVRIYLERERESAKKAMEDFVKLEENDMNSYADFLIDHGETIYQALINMKSQ